MKKTLGIMLVALAVAAGSGCERSKANARPEPQAQPRPVRLKRAVLEPLERKVLASGSVLAVDQAAVAFEVPGRVERAVAELGDAVRHGQVLAALAPEEYAIHEGMAAAQAAAADAAAEAARNGSRAEEIDAAHAAVRQAEAGAALAKAEHERAEFLFQRKSATASDMDRARMERDLALQRLEEARAKAKAYETGLRTEDQKRVFAMADAAREQARLAKKKRGDAILTSPIDGYIARKEINTGQVTGAGIPAYLVVSLNPLKVQVGVAETEIALLRAGQTAEITAQALGSRVFQGRVKRVGVAADPATRLFPVEIEIANPDHALKPGMVAQAAVATGQTEQLLAVPAQAIVRSPEGVTSVFVRGEGGRAFLRRVDTGTMLNGSIVIRSGLKEGDEVVIEGQHGLAEGAPIRPLEEK